MLTNLGPIVGSSIMIGLGSWAVGSIIIIVIAMIEAAILDPRPKLPLVSFPPIANRKPKLMIVDKPKPFKNGESYDPVTGELHGPVPFTMGRKPLTLITSHAKNSACCPLPTDVAKPCDTEESFVPVAIANPEEDVLPPVRYYPISDYEGWE